MTKSVKIDAKRLRLAATIAGIDTDKKLAEISGVDERTIRNIRANGSCSFDVWNKLASSIGCNPIDLLVTEGYPAPKWAALAALLA